VTLHVPGVVTLEDAAQVFPARLRAREIVPPPTRVSRAVTLLGGLPAASTVKVKVVEVEPLRGVTDPFCRPAALITGPAHATRPQAASRTRPRPRRNRGA
jgi:hypothetical protein